MSYTPTPPPPPPKPSSHPLGSPQPWQNRYSSNPTSPAQGQTPPLPPHPSQHTRPSPYPPRTSSWTAPYPPDDGLRRVTSEEGTSRQQVYSDQMHDYGNQQYSPQSPSQQGQPGPLQQQPRQVQQPQQPPQQQPPYPLPPEVSSKSKTDLAHVLATPDLLNALVNNPATAQSSLTSSRRNLQQQLAANISLATTLRELEGTLDAARANTSARLLSVRGLETAWKKKQGEMERRLEPWAPRELHQRLGQAIAEQEGMCVALERSFIDGGPTDGEDGDVASEREVAEWVRRVREGRRLVALRRERKRRWDEGRVGGWR